MYTPLSPFPVGHLNTVRFRRGRDWGLYQWLVGLGLMMFR